MNPIGIAVAFTMFWAAIGLGLFLCFSGIIGFGQSRKVYGLTAEHSVPQVVGSLRYAVMLVIGLALLVAGGYANYVVLYR